MGFLSGDATLYSEDASWMIGTVADDSGSCNTWFTNSRACCSPSLSHPLYSKAGARHAPRTDDVGWVFLSGTTTVLSETLEYLRAAARCLFCFSLPRHLFMQTNG